MVLISKMLNHIKFYGVKSWLKPRSTQLWIEPGSFTITCQNLCPAQAQTTGCKGDQDLYCIVVADLNVPGAKNSETLNELCSAIQFCNDLAPTRTVCLLELPEVAKKSSKRGLADEESEVQTCLWSLRQSCDARWICPFNVHPTADAQTNRRKHFFNMLSNRWSLSQTDLI